MIQSEVAASAVLTLFGAELLRTAALKLVGVVVWSAAVVTESEEEGRDETDWCKKGEDFVAVTVVLRVATGSTGEACSRGFAFSASL